MHAPAHAGPCMPATLERRSIANGTKRMQSRTAGARIAPAASRPRRSRPIPAPRPGLGAFAWQQDHLISQGATARSHPPPWPSGGLPGHAAGRSSSLRAACRPPGAGTCGNGRRPSAPAGTRCCSTWRPAGGGQPRAYYTNGTMGMCVPLVRHCLMVYDQYD